MGRGVPLPTGEGAREGAVPLPRKIFDFGSQYGQFWCILDGIFYSSVNCFKRKTGLQQCALYNNIIEYFRTVCEIFDF